MDIYLLRNGQQAGPYNEGQIRHMLAGGTLKDSDYAWSSGLSDWKQVKDIIKNDIVPSSSSNSVNSGGQSTRGKFSAHLIIYAVLLIILAGLVSYIFISRSSTRTQVDSTSSTIVATPEPVSTPQSPDPVASLKAIASQVPFTHFQSDPNSDGYTSDFVCKPLSYNVEKTDSLVSPYSGSIVFGVIMNHSDRADKWMVNFSWQNNEWIGKSVFKLHEGGQAEDLSPYQQGKVFKKIIPSIQWDM